MARKVIGMTRKVVGPTGSWRRRWAILLSIVLVVGAGVVIVRAVHDTGQFQLDGDASSFTNTVGTPSALDDWDKVCNEVTGGGVAGCGTTSVTTGSPANAVAWTTDNLVGNGPSESATTFTGGGSKDPQDINNWAWKDGAGGLPDKDNLLHAYAVRYSLPPSPNCPSGGGNTCDVIYFGSDRLDNSGDAQQGFWFLQNAIGLS